MERVIEFPDIAWDISSSASEQDKILSAIEHGQVTHFSNLAFALQENDKQLLSPNLLAGKTKNISYYLPTDQVRGVNKAVHPCRQKILQTFMRQFAQQADGFVRGILPHYQADLQIGRTSYRPAESCNRDILSPRKDDSLLHVDAFPSSPTQGKRILRLFCNINPEGRSRLWRLGDSFANVVERFSPQLPRPLPLSRKLMQLARVTRSYRSLYDHYMLRLHHTMKADYQYQHSVSQQKFEFPASSTWLVFTDQASHAALSGQYLLEQTFYLPVSAMHDQQLAPLAVLQQYLRRPLV